MITVFEITIDLGNVNIRLLFQAEPSLQIVRDTIEKVFETNERAKQELVTLLLSVGDDVPPETIMRVGDEIMFSNDEGPIGKMDLQSRTLFSA